MNDLMKLILDIASDPSIEIVLRGDKHWPGNRGTIRITLNKYDPERCEVSREIDLEHFSLAINPESILFNQLFIAHEEMKEKLCSTTTP